MSDLIRKVDKLLAMDASAEAWAFGANVLLHECLTGLRAAELKPRFIRLMVNSLAGDMVLDYRFEASFGMQWIPTTSQDVPQFKITIIPDDAATGDPK